MMRGEFEELVGHSIMDEDWRKIHEVYQWHPRDFSKDEIALLWIIGGREAIEGLLPLAKEMKELEEKRVELRRELDMVETRIIELKKIQEWKRNDVKRANLKFKIIRGDQDE